MTTTRGKKPTLKPRLVQGGPARSRKQSVADVPAPLGDRPEGYTEWLTELKARVHAAQQRASLAVNTEMLRLYWSLGSDILHQEKKQGWGASIVDQVSADLRAAFPEMKGFSRSNLMYMRAFAEAWPSPEFVQQPVGQLPWGHNVMLLTRLKSSTERLACARAALTYGWSRSALDRPMAQIANSLLAKEH